MSTARIALEKIALQKTDDACELKRIACDALVAIDAEEHSHYEPPQDDGIMLYCGGGISFRLPSAFYASVKAIAIETHKTQFATLTPIGDPLHATREECLESGNGYIAWISPQPD